MQSNWASENLQVIRTLMERSALYRRALAPIMLTVGLIGLAAGTAGYLLKINFFPNFILLWLATSVIALICSFLLVRRQAFKEKESFWSPPTRRVAHALAPPLFAGLVLSLLNLFSAAEKFIWPIQPWALPAIWMILYGCALHSAGFFMSRGVRFFGWIFVFFGLISLLVKMFSTAVPTIASGNIWMGVVFGGLHLAYGIYLSFTEKKNFAA
ncbi:MAG: hypothetical protein ABJC04_10070 [Verrucomicrobiota bacterium]